LSFLFQTQILTCSMNIWVYIIITNLKRWFGYLVMVFKATFNNISVIYLLVSKFYRGLYIQHYIIWQSLQGLSWSWSYGSWVFNYLCNQCLSPLKLWVQTPLMVRCTSYNIMLVMLRLLSPLHLWVNWQRKPYSHVIVLENFD
jgi:hypothetical protein